MSARAKRPVRGRRRRRKSSSQIRKTFRLNEAAASLPENGGFEI
jgi:hypothetical protein